LKRVRRNGSWLLAGVLAVLAPALLAQTPPASPAEAEAAKLLKDSQALWHKKQFEDALMKLARVQDEFGTTSAAADAGLWAGRVLVALGDPIAAMEEFQQVHNRWPKTQAAVSALAQGSLLRRLYARPAGNPAYGAPEKVGGDKLEGVDSLAVTGRNAVYRAGEKTLATVVTVEGDQPPTGVFTRPRLTLDTDGRLVVCDGGRLVAPAPAKALDLKMPRPNNPPKPLEKIDAAVQLSTGEWLVVDDNEKVIQKFSREGQYVQPFEGASSRAVKVSRLAVNAFDEVAALDDSESRIVLFDATGATKGSIPYRKRAADLKDPQDTAYELKDPKDLTFDAFGHLYVLDQKAMAIFSPFAVGPAKQAATRPATPGANRGDDYRLRTLFAETPEKGREGFKATAFAVDRSGAVYLYDESLKQVLVYR
jgi:hypothetical protein